MRLFGSLLGAAVVAGAGLAYYVHQRHQRTGASYLDVVRQLPDDARRLADQARRRGAEAFRQGADEARRRDAELAAHLQAAGAPAAGAGTTAV